MGWVLMASVQQPCVLTLSGCIAHGSVLPVPRYAPAGVSQSPMCTFGRWSPVCILFSSSPTLFFFSLPFLLCPSWGSFLQRRGWLGGTWGDVGGLVGPSPRRAW